MFPGIIYKYTGWGTDEKAMIDVLAHRDAAQRKQIKIAYEEQYKENLLKRIESEISGHFEVSHNFSFIFLSILEIIIC